jgi:DNA-binding transcriptional MerR regulator
MKISEVSKKYGLSQDTLRYYEKIGLIPPVNRNPGNIREYNEEDIQWIEFIKCMRGAGISVKVLVEYLRLFMLGNKTHEKRKAILIEERDKLEKKIEEMKDTLDRLNLKIAKYDTLLKKAQNKLSKKKPRKRPKRKRNTFYEYK